MSPGVYEPDDDLKQEIETIQSRKVMRVRKKIHRKAHKRYHTHRYRRSSIYDYGI